MPSEVSPTQQARSCRIHSQEALEELHPQRQKGGGGARCGGVGGMGSECPVGTECQFGKTRKSWRRMWGWLHDNVNVLDAPELYSAGWSRRWILCYAYFPQEKNKGPCGALRGGGCWLRRPGGWGGRWAGPREQGSRYHQEQAPRGRGQAARGGARTLPCSDPPADEEVSWLLGKGECSARPAGASPGVQGGLRGMDWIWRGSQKDRGIGGAALRLLLGRWPMMAISPDGEVGEQFGESSPRGNDK